MLIVLLAPLWIPSVAALVAVVLAARLITRIFLYSLVWTVWLGTSDRRVLFVYSDSPNWKAYAETRLLPRLPENAVVLNWSQRARWPRLSFPVMLFREFAGRQEFNPIGLVFERWRRVEDYRFWQPLRDAKHGHAGALEFLEAAFLRHAGSGGGRDENRHVS